MTLAEVKRQPSSPKRRKPFDFTGGMKTAPYTGKGLQRVDNMQFESGFLRRQHGVSTTRDTSESELYGIGSFQKTTTGEYQILYMIASGSKYKLRAWNTTLETTITPTGGAGDVEFVGDTFSFAQVGKTGFVGNNDATTPLYSWDGATLTAVTVAGALDPDRIDALWTDGKRLACIDKTQGTALFSQISGVLTAWSVGGDGSAVGGVYDSMQDLPTCGVTAGGYSIVFSGEEGQANKIQEISLGDGNLDIMVTTKVIGWNCRVGFSGPDKIAKSDNFVYGVKDQGLFKIDPYSGNSENLIEGSGAMERYWNTLDFSAAVVSYCPDEKMICISTKEKNAAVNDRLILFHEEYGSFYFKTNLFLVNMAEAGGKLYGITDNDGKVYRVFDPDNHTYFDDTLQRCRIVTEWDALGDVHAFKRVKKLSLFGSVFEDDTISIKTYVNGAFNNVWSNKQYTGQGSGDDSGGVAVLGEYELALGAPGSKELSDMIRKQRTSKKVITVCAEVECTTDKNFQIHGGLWSFKTRGQLTWESDLSKTIR